MRFKIVHSKPSEIAKRTAIFTAVGQVGSMFAGIMMTAMHKTMEGRGGLKGWQWVFLIGMCVDVPRSQALLTNTAKMA
jgi:ACS family pantothenate transporter-like MFS transporter